MTYPVVNNHLIVRTAKRTFAYELVGFGLIVALRRLDEALDIPHLLGAAPTPANWVESAIESAGVLVLGALVVWSSWLFLKHIRYLEGFAHVRLLPAHPGERSVAAG